MIQVAVTNFDTWRDAARDLITQGIAPERVLWVDDPSAPLLPMAWAVCCGTSSQPLRVKKEFVDRARVVACHRDPARWSLLYRMLHRLTHGEPDLLELITDDDTRTFDLMEKSVRRDRHKMTAFVRFRKIVTSEGEHYVAWYQPDHYIVRLAADHFRERFGAMRWSILTPDECVHWDGKSLSYTPGLPRDAAPLDDELESLWLTYYGSIFNPARLKLDAMRKEMPVRFWRELPEAQIIPELIQQAPSRVIEMIHRAQSAAAEANVVKVPDTHSLTVLRNAASACTRCPLYRDATQTVFGEGPDDADVVFVGEQPGDSEDLAGKPFIGPAGRLLDEVLNEVGIDRSRVYVTNAVKHFKFEPRGKRRIHAKPNAREMAACRVWVEKELQIIKPRALVLLGATAAQSLVGRQFRITQRRGEVFESDWSPWTMATFHPSALLRAPDGATRDSMRREFTSDLIKVASKIRERAA